MSDFDRNYAATRGAGLGRAAVIDAGLRAYMLRVYNYMAIGVALTGVAAWIAYSLAATTDPSLAVGRLSNGVMLVRSSYRSTPRE